MEGPPLEPGAKKKRRIQDWQLVRRNGRLELARNSLTGKISFKKSRGNWSIMPNIKRFIFFIDTQVWLKYNIKTY
ncbi:MAG TPA: hypothetical protein DCZ10_03260 [Pelotomaculum sp.]|nr:hypothetical protein [Pelotomaculum sp.]